MSRPKIVETRKVQRFGKSTLMVSLPSEWVRLVGLRPSDLVKLEVKEDGTLVVIPEKMAEKRGGVERAIKLVVSNNTLEEIVKRALYSTYILGYDKITVESVEGLISPHLMHGIRFMTRMLIGSEIVELSSNKVTVRVFVDAERYDLDSLIGRMVNALKSMLEHLMTSIKNEAPEYLKEVLELEFEMDRVHALAIRYIYSLDLREEGRFATEYRTLVEALENVGDLFAQISQSFIENPQLFGAVKALVLDRLEEVGMHLKFVMDLVLQAITGSDLYIASRAIDLAMEGVKFISRMGESTLVKHRSEEFLSVKMFFERLLLVCYNLQEASEAAFDIVMGKKGEVVELTK